MEKQDESSAVMDEISKIGGILGVSSDRHKAHFVSRICTCTTENSVVRNLDDFDLLHVSPVVYDQGWEYYRLIIFRHEDLRKLMQQLEEKGFVFDIVRKVSFDGFIASSLTLTADALFSDLTEKQMDALLTAYSHGYYRLPRRADVQSIASKRRVPRTTFQEHLKKAENKLVVSLVPYIQLYKQASPEKRERLKIR